MGNAQDDMGNAQDDMGRIGLITLEQLLESRDRRAAHQKELLAAFPDCALICLTVQLPGAVKRSPTSLLIGGAGLAALLDKFGSVLRHAQVRDLETGYEAYLLVPLPPVLVKKACCAIEDTHPLGRLMDIDVVGVDREALGLAPRRCLLCGQPARVCMRARNHTPEELLSRIEQMVAAYV